MPTLESLRQQYPMYNDLPDEKFIEGFHKKFYSDMPIEELNKKIGYVPGPRTPGVGEMLTGEHGGKSFPQFLWDKLLKHGEELPGRLMKAGSDAFKGSEEFDPSAPLEVAGAAAGARVPTRGAEAAAKAVPKAAREVLTPIAKVVSDVPVAERLAAAGSSVAMGHPVMGAGIAMAPHALNATVAGLGVAERAAGAAARPLTRAGVAAGAAELLRDRDRKSQLDSDQRKTLRAATRDDAPSTTLVAANRIMQTLIPSASAQEAPQYGGTDAGRTSSSTSGREQQTPSPGEASQPAQPAPGPAAGPAGPGAGPAGPGGPAGPPPQGLNPSPMMGGPLPLPGQSPGLSRLPTRGEAPIAATHGGKTFMQFAWDQALKGTKDFAGALKEAGRTAYEEPEKFDPSAPTKAAMMMVGGGTPFSKPGAVGLGGGELFGKYAKYAKDYPPVGPPKLMEKLPGGKAGKELDVSGKAADKLVQEGKAFWSKSLTEEATQFAADRIRVMREMEKGEYDPHFPLSMRGDVDPAHYPTPHKMSEATMPAKAETVEKYLKQYGTPAARDRLIKGYERGLQLPGADRWYFMKQLEDAYIKELGAKSGRERFAQEFAGGMAATTGGANPTANLLMQHYATFLEQKGLSVPAKSHQYPFPIGGRYAEGNMQQWQRFLENGKQLFGPKNPKRHDFAHAFLGHPLSVIDEQMTQALVPGLMQPEFYGPAQRVVDSVAKKMGVDPRGFQDVTWAGLKALKEEARTGKPFTYEGPMMAHINSAIERTHILTGVPREEIVRKSLVRKQMPLYGILAGIFTGAIAARENRDEPAGSRQ